MKKLLFLFVLCIFGLVSSAQIKQLSIGTSGYLSHSLASDTSLLLILEKDQILIWNLQTGRCIDSIKTNFQVKSAGFVDSQKIGIIYKISGIDRFVIFDIHAKHRIKELDFQQNSSYNNYFIFYDDENFYLSLPVEAKTWIYKKSNNKLLKTETNAIYSNESGLVIKHLYSPNSNSSYGFQNIKTKKGYVKNNLKTIKSFNSQSFDLQNNKLLIADAEQLSTINLYDITNGLKKIKTFTSKASAINFVSLLLNDRILIIDSYLNVKDMKKRNFLTIRNLTGKTISSIELDSGVLNNISINSNHNSIVYHTSNTIKIITI